MARAAAESQLLDEIVRQLCGEADAVLVRRPVIDPRTPETSDVDIAAFAEMEDIRPARLHIGGGEGTRATMVDITWIPSGWLADPSSFAARGLVPHRVLGSQLLWSASDLLAGRISEIAAHFYEPDVQRRRFAAYFEMGRLTVREIGVTWDFPALALFWLHMAFAACLSAGVDASRRLCPNVYTRPFDYLRELARAAGDDLVGAWRSALHAGGNVDDSIAAVRRMHGVIASRFSEPQWADVMRVTTRCEYRYWVDPRELEWRLRAAAEMAGAGDREAAVHYVRFYAYALLRAPMVFARAQEGRDVSYLRPERAVLRDLERICPDILEDANIALAGTRAPDRTIVDDGLAALQLFRARILETMNAAGAPVPELTPWTPHGSAAV